MILIGRQPYTREDGNDRNHDHEFDQCEAMLRAHDIPLNQRRKGPARAPSCRSQQAGFDQQPFGRWLVSLAVEAQPHWPVVLRFRVTVEPLTLGLPATVHTMVWSLASL